RRSAEYSSDQRTARMATHSLHTALRLPDRANQLCGKSSRVGLYSAGRSRTIRIPQFDPSPRNPALWLLLLQREQRMGICLRWHSRTRRLHSQIGVSATVGSALFNVRTFGGESAPAHLDARNHL